MLSSTYILRYIEKRLGYKFNEIEIDPNEIIENIKAESLVTFSKFFPFQDTITVSQLDLIEGTSNEYYLNADFPIISVARFYDNSTMYAGGGLLPYTGNMIDPMSRQWTADAMSINKNPLTFTFKYPNIITITPALRVIGETKVLLNCVHPEHFGTIPMNLQDEFLKLVLYETKEVLYQIRHRFSNIQTPFGSIELFIDDLADATDRKQELLEKWRANVGKQANRKKIYVY